MGTNFQRESVFDKEMSTDMASLSPATLYLPLDISPHAALPSRDSQQNLKIHKVALKVSHQTHFVTQIGPVLSIRTVHCK